MNRLEKICALILGFVVVGSAQARCLNILTEVRYEETCTIVKTYKSTNLSENPILLVALHGDAPFHNPGYQYDFAKEVSKKSTNLVAIGMLRPGYTDTEYRRSDGIKGDAIGDNYDHPRIEQLANAIQRLKAHYKSKQVILAGHSGGAAITAKLIALYPNLIDHAVIVSCPCDINTWREDMYRLTNKPIFNGDLDVISPIELVHHLSSQIEITIFVGKDDPVTRVVLSQAYKSALDKVKVNASMSIIPGKHNIFMESEIVNAVANIVGEYNKALPVPK